MLFCMTFGDTKMFWESGKMLLGLFCTKRNVVEMIFDCKVLCKILLDCLFYHTVDDVIPESQSSFYTSHVTTDIIFSTKLLQQNFTEQDLNFYQVFIDLTQTFDGTNRTALQKISNKLGCPENFIDILWHFLEDLGLCR